MKPYIKIVNDPIIDKANRMIVVAKILFCFALLLLIFTISRAGQGLTGLDVKLPSVPVATTIVCDNGLGDWLRDTNHQMGAWVARSTRIVKIGVNFQPQFRDANNTNDTWKPLFERDKSWDSLFFAQYHLRKAFEIRVGVTDGMADGFKTATRALTNK